MNNIGNVCTKIARCIWLLVLEIAAKYKLPDDSKKKTKQKENAT